jgi:hypothetical protein
MRIAILDADLIGRKRHRFPNLACMKLSGYHKALGEEVVLKTDYDVLDSFDRVYISKVFTDTPVPEAALKLSNINYGGTGFFYDKAPALPEAVEHQMPDYHLYDGWMSAQLAAGKKPREFSYYTDYSIGFLTRGCFRKCVFCVNQNYDRVRLHSPLSEFVDSSRKKICLLDDNFFGCPDWRRLLTELQSTGRPFQFKQGLDERLLTDEKCAALFGSRYDGDYIFAFDNVADAELIEQKIQLARKYTNAVLKFYCFCGFDRSGKWDADFWQQDIFDLLFRIRLLMRHRCLPYVMRFERYKESPYRGMYVTLARWCNQPSFFKKKSLWEFAEANGRTSACFRYVSDFRDAFPKAIDYLCMKFN